MSAPISAESVIDQLCADIAQLHKEKALLQAQLAAHTHEEPAGD